MLYIFIIPFLIIIYWIFLVIKYSKKKLLSDEKREFILNNFKKIFADIDIKHKIIDYDKLYHKILVEIWYEWSFGEILKLEPKEISDINKIWELHKLRNKLVHDFDLLDDGILNKKAEEYKGEIERLLGKV